MKSPLYYLDGIVIFSPEFQQDLRRQEDVSTCLAEAKRQLNLKKYRSAAGKVTILGHVISKDRVISDTSKLMAVAEFRKPTSTKALRSFLGLCSYFRSFARSLTPSLHH